MTTQLWIIAGTLLVFIILGVMLSFSIKKHEARRIADKKKKGRNRYMPQYKGPGGK